MRSDHFIRGLDRPVEGFRGLRFLIRRAVRARLGSGRFGRPRPLEISQKGVLPGVAPVRYLRPYSIASRPKPDGSRSFSRGANAAVSSQGSGGSCFKGPAKTQTGSTKIPFRRKSLCLSPEGL